MTKKDKGIHLGEHPLHSLPVMAHSINTEGVLIDVSQAWLEIMGYERKEVIGRKSIEFLTPESQKYAENILSDFMKTGSCQDIAYSMVTKDGSLVDVLLSATAEFDENGQVKHSLAFMNDVTHLRQAQETLKKKTLFLERAEEIAHIGHWYLDIRNNNELFWSDEIYTIHGLEKETYTPSVETAINAYHPDDRLAVVEKIEKSIENKQSFTFELRITRPDGQIRFVRSLGEPELDKDSNVIALFGVFQDITEKKKQDEALKEVEELYEFSIKASNAAIWDWHIEKDQIYWLGNTHLSLGLQITDGPVLTSKKFFEFVHPDDQEKLKQAFSNHFKQQEQYEIEVRILNNSQEYSWFLSRGQAIWDDAGKAIRMCGSLSNIDQQKEDKRQLEESRAEAEKATKAKSEFLAKMSHEIRTPLNGIVGFAELLRQTELNDYQLHCVNQTFGAGRVLARLVDDILEFAKVESGKTIIEYAEFNLDTVIELCVGLVKAEADRKELDININIDSQIPEKIISDQYRLQQVFLNLLTNAIEFTDTGHIDVSVKLAKQDKNLILNFEVSDTGIGIPHDKLDVIFDSFIQGNERSNRTFGGTGLGLTVVKQIIDAMDGEISIASEVNKGTTFYFKIPISSSSEEDSEDIVGIENNLITDERTAFILLVEDIPMNQEVAMAILVQHGHQVQVACNGKEAVEAIKQGSFDLVLMDIKMPEMNGIEATKVIRDELKIGQTDLPIIALTAHALPHEVKNCFEAGMNDYMTKPINTEELTTKINEWVYNDIHDPFAMPANIEQQDCELNEMILGLNDQDNVSTENDSLISSSQLSDFSTLIGSEKIYEIFEDFQNDFHERKLNLIDLSSNKELIIDELHSLASTSGNLGMTKLSMFCRQIMDELKSNDENNWEEYLEEFLDLYNESVQAFELAVDTNSPSNNKTALL